MTLLHGAALAQDKAHRLDRRFTRRTVDSLEAVVQREYFSPEVAGRVSDALDAGWAGGRYGRLESLDSLAATLTRDMYKVSHDKHLAVTLVRRDGTGPPAKTVAAGPSPGKGNAAAQDKREAAPANPDSLRALRGRRENFGIQRVEILPGNIGYLAMTHFYRPEEARDGIAAAMSLLRHADALILDMRDNGGGSPGTVAFLASYLFDQAAMPLFEIVPRSGTSGHGYATDDTLPPGHDGTRPVYVLTSKNTFSGGEGFPFLLQERGRAEIIGEQTAGAANPGRPYPLNDRLEVTVPNGQIRSAVRGGNWEGTGVVPDVPVAASEALRVARTHALRALIERAPEGEWRAGLERELGGVERGPE
jgi:hypothetical protein